MHEHIQLKLSLDFACNDNIIKRETEKAKFSDPFYQKICSCLNFTSKNQMPKVNAYTGEIPNRIIGYGRNYKYSVSGYAVHFFESDSKFMNILNQPNTSFKKLQKYGYVIAPDFSVQPQMPDPIKRGNIFKIKMLAAWWQYKGIKVIPNVVWCTQDTFEYCFEGLPRHSVIAINSTGIGYDLRSKQCWIEGYNKAIKILQPIHIIRYGAKQKDEKEEISTYFFNDNRVNSKI